MSEISTASEAGRYEIRLKGHLDNHWATWFDGLTLTSCSDGTTIIHGVVVDQSALHGLLQKVRDIGLPLLSVSRVPPAGPAESLESVAHPGSDAQTTSPADSAFQRRTT